MGEAKNIYFTCLKSHISCQTKCRPRCFARSPAPFSVWLWPLPWLPSSLFWNRHQRWRLVQEEGKGGGSEVFQQAAGRTVGKASQEEGTRCQGGKGKEG